MSNRIREINKITTTMISISVRPMVYTLIIPLLYEAVARGYVSGHEIFFVEAADGAPGQDMVIRIDSKKSVSDTAQFLAHKGLIKSEFAFTFQSRLYDYETIYPSTYTLDTSMTPKRISQPPNEKPETEDSAKPAQSEGVKAAEVKTVQGRISGGGSGGSAASGQETFPETAVVPSSDAGVPADAAPRPQAGIDATDAQEVQADEQIYEGEDQEMEGGWTEDATEDGTQ